MQKGQHVIPIVFGTFTFLIIIAIVVMIAYKDNNTAVCQQWDVKSFSYQKRDNVNDGLYTKTDLKPDPGYEPFGLVKFGNSVTVLTRKCADDLSAKR